MKVGVKVWNLNRKKMGTADSVFLRRYSSYGSLSHAFGDMYVGSLLPKRGQTSLKAKKNYLVSEGQ